MRRSDVELEDEIVSFVREVGSVADALDLVTTIERNQEEPCAPISASE